MFLILHAVEFFPIILILSKHRVNDYSNYLSEVLDEIHQSILGRLIFSPMWTLDRAIVIVWMFHKDYIVYLVKTNDNVPSKKIFTCCLLNDEARG